MPDELRATYSAEVLFQSGLLTRVRVTNTQWAGPALDARAPSTREGAQQDALHRAAHEELERMHQTLKLEPYERLRLRCDFWLGGHVETGLGYAVHFDPADFPALAEYLAPRSPAET